MPENDSDGLVPCPRCEGENIKVILDEPGIETQYYCTGCTLIYTKFHVWMKERLGDAS